MRLIRGDARKALPKMEDASFDVIATDMPYGEVQLWGEGEGNRSWGDHGGVGSPTTEYHLDDKDFVTGFMTLKWFLGEAARLLKPDGVLYMTLGRGWILPQAFLQAANAGFKTRPLVWYNPDAMPQQRGHPWKTNANVCLFGYRKLRKRDGEIVDYAGRGAKNLFEAIPPRGRTRVHPTQKPVKLFEEWLKQTPGRVLDPFMGVGTTLVAAQRLGLDGTGVETEKRWVEEAQRRLREERNGARFK